jgi:hypothetical protein
VTLVAGGCGVGFHRGPYGGCRPNIAGYPEVGYGGGVYHGGVYHGGVYRGGVYRRGACTIAAVCIVAERFSLMPARESVPLGVQSRPRPNTFRDMQLRSQTAQRVYCLVPLSKTLSRTYGSGGKQTFAPDFCTMESNGFY